MCGIAGIWNAPSSEPPEIALGGMLDAMVHRGPDGRGTMTYAGGAAGMVRLALVDLSPSGQQPIWSPCGRVAILFNGEIYNFREERARLETAGHQFRTATDTEVILALYLELGVRFVDRLRGMFAIALFDWRNSSRDGIPELVLARSPFGIKPFYVANPNGNANSIVFASELRSLLASNLIPRRIDPLGLNDYLCYGFVIQPRTMIDGVRMLAPGSIEHYRPGRQVDILRFWTIPSAVPRTESFDESAERLRHELEESVRLHSLADTPVGAFLSGGIDSTVIVALMRKHIDDLRTYTLRFPDFPGNDEVERAEMTARRLGCRSTIVDVTASDANRLLPEFAANLDQPSTDGLNAWIISRAAARDVKAVLSGIGGDEMFAGYPVVGRMVQAAKPPWSLVRRPLALLAHSLRYLPTSKSTRDRIANFAARRSLFTIWVQPHRVFSPDHVRQMICRMPDIDPWVHEFAGLQQLIGADGSSETPVGLACLLDVRAYCLCQLLRDADVTSMAHSLELRVPFIDLKIAEFSRTCRDEYKISSSTRRETKSGKRVLIHAVRDLLSADADSAPKRGFTLPYANWMRKGLQPNIADTCDLAVIKKRGLIDPQYVRPLITAHKQPDVGNDQLYPQLWSLMVLEYWARSMLDSSIRRTAKPIAVLQ